MPEPVLIVEKSEKIATLTLNRPEVMNALSKELRAALYGAFEDLRNDPGTGVIILTGAGRAFCSGLDLKELAKKGMKPEDADDVGLRYQASCPIIGAINGPAVAGGFEIALACDILIASNEARFADTHARVGYLPGAGLSQRLSRLIGIGRAKEISFTGNFISAPQALEWGLVNRVVEPDALIPACRALARDILSCAPGMVEKYKRLIDEGYGMTLSDALKHERRAFLEHMRTVSKDSIASRREEIIGRGRVQKGRGDLPSARRPAP